MESSVLNLAHQKQRRAEAFLKKRQFDEAIKCHEEVYNLLVKTQLELLSKLCYLSNNRTKLNKNLSHYVTLESIILQKDYHKRQAEIVRMKQAKYEEYKAKVESQKSEMLNKQLSKTSEKYEPNYYSDKEEKESLQQVIYRVINKQDNLLNLICQSEDDEKPVKSSKEVGGIVDELKSVNSQLRSLVHNLLSQLELKEEEIKKLKDQLSTSSNIPSEEAPLEDIHSVHLEPLPPLAPIEMPEFNLNST